MTRKIIFTFPMVCLFSLYSISDAEGSIDPKEVTAKELPSLFKEHNSNHTSFGVRKDKKLSKKKYRIDSTNCTAEESYLPIDSDSDQKPNVSQKDKKHFRKKYKMKRKQTTQWLKKQLMRQ